MTLVGTDCPIVQLNATAVLGDTESLGAELVISRLTGIDKSPELDTLKRTVAE